ncbi:hypothetical protein LFT51_20540 [Mycobacterium intracellulare subsp. chimaera]|uniref:hypothetical protein n=1 Tax=Mycobacterium intracellulare TaxID=1767 RepID=UPI000B60DC9E|nr:hypothetical protein [Mycobacterium intracellulare]ASL22284.1 hypothetical protein MYCOZU1_03889 [Mycobacterium intracellulare subsp. chimaera]UCN02712.1 hypothetical protein LFT51_20540 [Mycobacterium intracellulare subsp. chimaera]
MRPTSVPARLVEAGVPVVTGDARSITYRDGNHAVTAELVLADRVSSPASVLGRDRGPGHRIFLICETISEEARSALLADTNVDLSVASTGELVLSGTTYRAPVGARPHRGAGERSWRRRAAERVCVLTREHLRQSDLAAAIAVSQQAVSKMVEKEPLPDTPMAPDARRESLVELASVPADDGVVETYWYGMDPVTDQVRSAIRLGAELTVPVIAGGEVAADVLAPWRVPRHGLVYAQELIDLTDFGLVQATAEEATLTVRVPADSTVWATAAWWNQLTDVQHSDIITADPVVVLQDMNAGADAGDGALQRLDDWIAGR